MHNEVQYERMRPRQIVATRQKCPVAYLPLGTIEWHGHHGPTGFDTITSHALAIRCAQATGGLVFPPLWYGESRSEGLIETGAEDRENIHQEMNLPTENFDPGYMRFSCQQQYENYQRLLLHCMHQIQSLGFKLLVFTVGHYPLLDHARAACCVFHQSRWNNKRANMITWAFVGNELIQDTHPDTAGHADYWETSLMLALEPNLIDLNELPKDPKQKPVGIISDRPVQQASADFGEKAITRIVERVSTQVKDRLENPQRYRGHGWQA